MTLQVEGNDNAAPPAPPAPTAAPPLIKLATLSGHAVLLMGLPLLSWEDCNFYLLDNDDNPEAVEYEFFGSVLEGQEYIDAFEKENPKEYAQQPPTQQPAPAQQLAPAQQPAPPA